MRPQIMDIDTSRLAPQATSKDKQEQPADPAPAAPAGAQPAPVPLTMEQLQDLQKRIIATLCTCFDPEIPVNIYELGLIYDVEMTTGGVVGIKMTLTSPGCPVAGTLPGDVQRRIQGLEGVTSARVDVVWEPPWDKSRMSEAAKLQLGIDDW